MELYDSDSGKTTTENKVNEKGENVMAEDFGTQDIITGRGLGIGGFGYGQGYGPFASPGMNAVRLDRNSQMTENQADCTREVLSTDIAGVRQSFENLTRDNQFSAITKSVNDSEFRNIDRFSNIERELNANARAAAECCCDTKLLIKDTTIDNLRAEAATNNKNEILNAMAGQTNALSCAINSLNQVVQNICAPKCCPS